MTIYVTVATCQGVIADITAYLTQESAQKAERRWLKQHRIRNNDDREGKSRNGTEFVLRECKLKP
ncbi:MAG: hypothetical protein HUU46_19270 [Candidatus Hydrogenedentes bacterium]|nr:hypothetical protein [Candidatus Hydrogenedentota bacterium]